MNLSPRDRGTAAFLCVILLWKTVAVSPSVIDGDVFGKLGSLCWSPRGPRERALTLLPHHPCFGPLKGFSGSSSGPFLSFREDVSSIWLEPALRVIQLLATPSSPSSPQVLSPRGWSSRTLHTPTLPTQPIGSLETVISAFER